MLRSQVFLTRRTEKEDEREKGGLAGNKVGMRKVKNKVG